MDSTVLNRFQKLKLRLEEEDGFYLSSSNIQASTEECIRSLIGKVYGEKITNFTGLKNTLSALWSFIGPLEIRELGVNQYQFVFSSQDDKRRILNGKTWTFDAEFLILKPWTKELDILNETFNRIQVWIQIWNLPTHWISKETGLKFKNLFCDISDV